MQRISCVSADLRKNRREKPNDSRRFQQNFLPDRTGEFFCGAGNSNSLLRRKQGYFADAPPVSAQEWPAEKMTRIKKTKSKQISLDLLILPLARGAASSSALAERFQQYAAGHFQ
jgi:hypothetical protein